jgi:hypothetical protein
MEAWFSLAFEVDEVANGPHADGARARSIGAAPVVLAAELARGSAVGRGQLPATTAARSWIGVRPWRRCGRARAGRGAQQAWAADAEEEGGASAAPWPDNPGRAVGCRRTGLLEPTRLAAVGAPFDGLQVVDGFCTVCVPDVDIPPFSGGHSAASARRRCSQAVYLKSGTATGVASSSTRLARRCACRGYPLDSALAELRCTDSPRSRARLGVAKRLSSVQGGRAAVVPREPGLLMGSDLGPRVRPRPAARWVWSWCSPVR